MVKICSNRPPDEGGGRGVQGTMVSSPLKSYFATNVFLEIRFFCHSPRHPKLIWPWTFQNLVGSPEQIYRRTSIPKYDFNKVAKQFYINHNSVWMFSCKLAACFQNTFSWEHLWRAASEHEKQSAMPSSFR